MDLRKAFDIVDRTILVNKLTRYGLRGSVSDFIKSYLSNIKQHVSLNSLSSDVILSTHGVPQGSVLTDCQLNFLNIILQILINEAVHCIPKTHYIFM